ncbi:MAG: hypothetical protein OMM_06238 [Candidatus Magnetoglobus multicellularis str. Araruama]|uniref:Uncharacterized protein n=1 Tax=Candidatus Magnetoglobus multicellularis str. Araruama TaxID=890399 RepID=A0A1V1PII4_9BACT|nr:MAG: hypothetical protein OMM_06238 [Candidatus Magnetoglobus multicellularis str. Araruama]
MSEYKQEEKKNQFQVKPKNITIRTADGSTLSGKVNIGENERVSDVFTKTDNPFVVLFDAATAQGCGRVYFINKTHIVWVEPED